MGGVEGWELTGTTVCTDRGGGLQGPLCVQIGVGANRDHCVYR